MDRLIWLRLAFALLPLGLPGFCRSAAPPARYPVVEGRKTIAVTCMVGTSLFEERRSLFHNVSLPVPAGKARLEYVIVQLSQTQKPTSGVHCKVRIVAVEGNRLILLIRRIVLLACASFNRVDLADSLLDSVDHALSPLLGQVQLKWDYSRDIECEMTPKEFVASRELSRLFKGDVGVFSPLYADDRDYRAVQQTKKYSAALIEK